MMKIGVISDTHGSLSAWRLAWDRCLKTADLIIHCGDVLYHGPRNPLPDGYDPKALAEELNSLAAKLIIVKGNCDAEVDQLVLEYPLESPYAHVISPGLSILAHHGHLWSPDTMPLKVKGIYQLFISGHTHLPELTESEGRIYLNPGSPALPKDAAKTQSVALIDGGTIRIIDLNTGGVVAEARVI